MHEYPIAIEIIRIATKHAVENKIEKIRKINLVVGDYCGYVADSIKLYFEIYSENTVCCNAEIEIERVKPMLKCCDCTKLFLRKPFEFICPHCGGKGIPTETGREFYIKSIEGE